MVLIVLLCVNWGVSMYLDRNKRSALVTQDNRIIEACYTMTLNEKRLLMLGISQLDSQQFTLDKIRFEVSSERWLEYFGDKNAWQSMKRAAEKLATRTVKLHPKTGHIKTLSWFDMVDYFEAEGRIVVEFGRNISSNLIALYSNFTRIRLFAITNFTSIHSIRLYELLSQFRTTGIRRMAIEDFRFAMDCVEKYKDTRKLNARVLQPALREINEKSDLVCKVQNTKQGRKITHIKFLFSERLPQISTQSKRVE